MAGFPSECGAIPATVIDPEKHLIPALGRGTRSRVDVRPGGKPDPDRRSGPGGAGGTAHPVAGSAVAGFGVTRVQRHPRRSRSELIAAAASRLASRCGLGHWSKPPLPFPVRPDARLRSDRRGGSSPDCCPTSTGRSSSAAKSSSTTGSPSASPGRPSPTSISSSGGPSRWRSGAGRRRGWRRWRSCRRDEIASRDRGFGVRAEWTVGGMVTHFGHRHFRQNRYNALHRRDPGGWNVEDPLHRDSRD